MTVLPRFVVKVCGITSGEDAETAIEAGANALGFNFYEGSPRRVTVEQAAAITEGLPAGVLRVGVFVKPGMEEIGEAMERAALDVAQVHGESQTDWQREWRAWKVIAPGAEPSSSDGWEAFLVDTPSDKFGGSGKTFDWKLARGARRRVILAGGLDGENVAEAIRVARPWGVDACSRLEAWPGKKHRARVERFVREAWRAADELDRVS